MRPDPPTWLRLPPAQSQKLEALRLNEAEMRRRFHIDLTSTTFTPNWLTSEAAEGLRASTDAHHLLEGEFQVPPPRRRRHFTEWYCMQWTASFVAVGRARRLCIPEEARPPLRLFDAVKWQRWPFFQVEFVSDRSPLTRRHCICGRFRN